MDGKGQPLVQLADATASALGSNRTDKSAAARWGRGVSQCFAWVSDDTAFSDQLVISSRTKEEAGHQRTLYASERSSACFACLFTCVVSTITEMDESQSGPHFAENNGVTAEYANNT